MTYLECADAFEVYMMSWWMTLDRVIKLMTITQLIIDKDDENV